MSAHAAAEKQPQPLLTRAGIITALTVLAALLTYAGAGSVSAWLGAHADAIATVILAIGPVVTALLARAHVTPVASPKDNAGNDLVPTGSAPATLDAQTALSDAEKVFPTSDPA